MKKLEELLEWGGTKRDITFLILSAAALLASIFGFQPLPFDMAWVSVILCGIPIILEALIGLLTALISRLMCWSLLHWSHLSSSAKISLPARWLSLCSWALFWRV